MQYEAIILELMTRIKKLEDEVAQLKESIVRGQCREEALRDGSEETPEGREKGSYQKMNDAKISPAAWTASPRRKHRQK